MITVIMSVLNGAKTIAEQLDALNNQTYSFDWELLIIDNGSTDDTVKIVQAYCSKMPNLTLLHYTKQKGKAYCCNYAMQFVEGEYLAFCDADDVVSPSWLEAIVKGLAQSDLVTGPTKIEEINDLPFQWRPPSATNTTLENALGFLPYFSGSNFGIRREVYLLAGGYSESFMYQQDVELSWRLQLAGYQLLFVPEAVVHYRYRDSFRSTWKQLTNYADAHVNLYKHYKEYGMPPASLKVALNRYKWLIMRAPKFLAVLLSKRRYPLQALWVYMAALSWGRLRGTIKYRRFYL